MCQELICDILFHICPELICDILLCICPELICDILLRIGPEPAFQLTGSEFRTVVEGLASEEQKLTSFEQLLDLEKDSATGNDLPLMQRAENMLYCYQCLPDSSIEKLVSALYSIGLSLPAETISLSKKK